MRVYTEISSIAFIWVRARFGAGKVSDWIGGGADVTCLCLPEENTVVLAPDNKMLDDAVLSAFFRLVLLIFLKQQYDNNLVLLMLRLSRRRREAEGRRREVEDSSGPSLVFRGCHLVARAIYVARRARKRACAERPE